MLTSLIKQAQTDCIKLNLKVARQRLDLVRFVLISIDEKQLYVFENKVLTSIIKIVNDT